MLVLMRRLNEEVLIPSLGVRLKIVDTRTNRVRIAIDAPAGLGIRRAELPGRPPQVMAVAAVRHS